MFLKKKHYQRLSSIHANRLLIIRKMFVQGWIRGLNSSDSKDRFH